MILFFPGIELCVSISSPDDVPVPIPVRMGLDSVDLSMDVPAVSSCL